MEVPSYRDTSVCQSVKVNFYVINGKRKRSQPQHFTYTPLACKNATQPFYGAPTSHCAVRYISYNIHPTSSECANSHLFQLRPSKQSRWTSMKRVTWASPCLRSWASPLITTTTAHAAFFTQTTDWSLA